MAEWQRLSPEDPSQLAALAVGLTALILAVRRRDLIFTGGLGVAAAGSVIAIRLLPILVLLALPVLAASASRPRVLRYLHSRRVVLYLGLAAGVVVALPSLVHIGRPDPAYYRQRSGWRRVRARSSRDWPRQVAQHKPGMEIGRFGPGHGPVCARAAVALRHFPWVGP
jgi:hypothetical protein